MPIPLKKIKTGRKFRYNGVLYRVIAKRAYGTVVAIDLEKKDDFSLPKFDKETPVEPAD